MELDFKHRIELGLDTGGGNWLALYRYADPAAVGAAAEDTVREQVGGMDAELQRFDGAFVHIAGASYREGLKEPGFREALARHLWSTYLPGEQPVLPI